MRRQLGYRRGVHEVDRQRHEPALGDAFTEGLVYRGGWLYESTGLEGASSLRRVETETGRIDAAVSLPGDVFGEGLAAVGSRLVQLTWRSGRAFVYGLDSMQVERELRYDGEGWGLCHDGERLVMSDGSSVLQFRDPETFELVGSVEVRHEGAPVTRLNELECVGTDVYANIWLTRRIVRIDVASGEVTGLVDVGDILSRDGVGDISGVDVLNGIVYLPGRDRFLITGKYWPRVFEVAFVPRASGAAAAVE